MNQKPLTDVYALTLTAPDGRERHTLVWLPTEEVKQDFYAKAQHNGLTVTCFIVE